MHAPHERRRDLGCRGEPDPQAAQVVLRPGRVVQHVQVDRRRGRQDRDLLEGYPVDGIRHVEDGLGQHHRAGGDAGQDARLEPEHVEVRVDHEVAIARLQPGHGDPVQGRDERAGVGHHDALGYAGRSRGEQDVADVVRRHRAAALGHLSARVRCCAREELAPVRRAVGGRPVGVDDRPQVRPLGPGGSQHLDVVIAEELRRGDEHAGRAPVEDGGRLVALEPRVDRYQHCPCLEQAKRRDDPLGTVVVPDRHAVTALDAAGHQGRRELGGTLGELGVGELGGAVSHGRLVAQPLAGGLEVRGNRPGGRTKLHAVSFAAATVRPVSRCRSGPCSR